MHNLFQKLLRLTTCQSNNRIVFVHFPLVHNAVLKKNNVGMVFTCTFDNRENGIKYNIVDYCLPLSNCYSLFLVGTYMCNFATLVHR